MAEMVIQARQMGFFEPFDEPYKKRKRGGYGSALPTPPPLKAFYRDALSEAAKERARLARAERDAAQYAAGVQAKIDALIAQIAAIQASLEPLKADAAAAQDRLKGIRQSKHALLADQLSLFDEARRRGVNTRGLIDLGGPADEDEIDAADALARL